MLPYSTSVVQPSTCRNPAVRHTGRGQQFVKPGGVWISEPSMGQWWLGLDPAAECSLVAGEPDELPEMIQVAGDLGVSQAPLAR